MDNKSGKRKKEIRVRIAPSPTGPFHVGSARTALANFLFARQNKGTFVLRIEDTDKERSKKKWEENILASLQWLGIEWDEGPLPQQDNTERHAPSIWRGAYGPYRQSERTDIYKPYLEKLLSTGSAFYCWHTVENLTKEQERQIQAKEAPRHICEFRELAYEDVPIEQKSR